jgi:hypothetical protein
LLKLVPELLQKLREGLESISYSPFETSQLFKQLETLHLTRLRAVPKVAEPGTKTVDAINVSSIKAATEKLAQARSVAKAAEDAARSEQSKVEVVAESLPAAQSPVLTSSNAALAIAEIAPVAPAANDEAGILTKPEQGEAAKSVISEVAVEGRAYPEDSSSAVAADSPGQAEPVATESAVAPLVPINASLESLETFVVMSDELEAVAAEPEMLPEGDQHLVLVGNITQGSWFEMQSDDGQKVRCRLAAIIRATGKYIFVNRSGVKVAEETRMTLAMALKSGRLQVLDDGMLFDRALEAVIGNLRANR